MRRRRPAPAADEPALARMARLFDAREPGVGPAPDARGLTADVDGDRLPALTDADAEADAEADAGADVSWAPAARPAWASLPPAVPDATPDAEDLSDAPAPMGLLPDTLRGGRLDPGRSGAVALLVVCLLAAAVAAGVVLRGRPQEVAVPAVEHPGGPLPGASAAPTEPSGELVVSVAGEVVTPGLVRLPVGSRVDDAVRAAGGLRPGASHGLLNLARRLVDGEQVLVGVEPPSTAPGAARGGTASGALVDLNAATAADLQELPGIGPVLAERIVEWRTENGPFRSVDQLREVPGIGEAKYTALKPKVAV